MRCTWLCSLKPGVTVLTLALKTTPPQVVPNVFSAQEEMQATWRTLRSSRTMTSPSYLSGTPHSVVYEGLMCYVSYSAL
jgi:hypothetical protein